MEGHGERERDFTLIFIFSVNQETSDIDTTDNQESNKTCEIYHLEIIINPEKNCNI